MWFCLEEPNQYIAEQSEYTKVIGLPKLFTIHSQGNGGIEAYFIGKQLYYRMLPISYSNPTAGSNGCLIAEFNTKTWYFLGLDHEKPKMFARSSQLQVTSYIN